MTEPLTDTAEHSESDAAAAVATETATDVPGFEGYDFCHEGISHRVYRSNDEGPVVLLMHELPGLNEHTVDFAQWLMTHGYCVHMPLLFGAAMKTDIPGNLLRICIRREIHLFTSTRSSPITPWLRALCRRLSADSGGNRIGVIGMCVTGGFVIPLLLDSAVQVAVAAQAALPLFRPRNPGVDDDVMCRASNVLGEKQLMALRFERDWMSARSRYRRFRHEYFAADDGSAQPGYHHVCIPGSSHSTLTSHYQHALSQSIDTRQRVLDLFDANLKPD